MLKQSRNQRNPYLRCDGISRRDLLQVGSLAAFGFDGGEPESLQAMPKESLVGRAKSCILIWLDGGPSHLETFDPKPSAPVEVRGPLQPISNANSRCFYQRVFATVSETDGQGGLGSIDDVATRRTQFWHPLHDDRL